MILMNYPFAFVWSVTIHIVVKPYTLDKLQKLKKILIICLVSGAEKTPYVFPGLLMSEVHILLVQSTQ